MWLLTPESPASRANKDQVPHGGRDCTSDHSRANHESWLAHKVLEPIVAKMICVSVIVTSGPFAVVMVSVSHWLDVTTAIVIVMTHRPITVGMVIVGVVCRLDITIVVVTREPIMVWTVIAIICRITPSLTLRGMGGHQELGGSVEAWIRTKKVVHGLIFQGVFHRLNRENNNIKTRDKDEKRFYRLTRESWS